MDNNQIKEVEAQTTSILRHLRSGKSITPLEALRLFSCLRLGARIKDLRDSGYNIKTEMVKYGRKRFAEYSLVN